MRKPSMFAAFFDMMLGTPEERSMHADLAHGRPVPMGFQSGQLTELLEKAGTAPPVAEPRKYEPIEATLVGVSVRLINMREERDDLDMQIRVLAERSRQLTVSCDALELAERKLDDAMLTVAVCKEIVDAKGL